MSRSSNRAKAQAAIKVLADLGYMVENIVPPNEWYCEGEQAEHWEKYPHTVEPSDFDESGDFIPNGECGYCGGQFAYNGFIPNPDMTVNQAAKALGLKVYDTALPQDWVTDMWERVGYKAYGQFVWCYDDATSWGEPVPLGPEAAAALAEYEGITERSIR